MPAPPAIEGDTTTRPSAPAGATPRAAGVRGLVVGLVGRDRFAVAARTYRLARARDELRAPFPLRAKLAAWQRGLRVENATIYDLSRNDVRDYVTDYQRNHRCPRLNSVPELFDSKLFLKILLATRGHVQAETVALVDRGSALLDPIGPDAHPTTIAELERRLVDDGGPFICKPVGGTRGADVFLVRARDGSLERQRGTAFAPLRLGALAGTMLVERVVEQGDFWRSVSPATFNTMRVLTMWTPGDEAPFVAVAVQRFGTVTTAPTDNWSGGGICARIDLDTGRLGVGRMHPTKGGRVQTVYARHPDTDAAIEGAVLPHWDRVRAEVLRAARAVLANRYVGWDVIVDRGGTPIIIEGNKNTDVNLLQVHGGLLVDPAIRRFYECTGVL